MFECSSTPYLQISHVFPAKSRVSHFLLSYWSSLGWQENMSNYSRAVISHVSHENYRHFSCRCITNSPHSTNKQANKMDELQLAVHVPTLILSPNALSVSAGCFAFGSSLAVLTFAQLKVLGVSTGSMRPIPTVLGMASVCLASLASHHTSITVHQATSSNSGKYKKRSLSDSVSIGDFNVSKQTLQMYVERCCVFNFSINLNLTPPKLCSRFIVVQTTWGSLLGDRPLQLHACWFVCSSIHSSYRKIRYSS